MIVGAACLVAAFAIVTVQADTAVAKDKGDPVTTLNGNHASRAERLRAIEALGISKDPRAIDILLKEISSMDEETAEAAAGALKKLGGAAQLEQRLKESHDVEERVRLCRALGVIGENGSVGVLILALKDENPLVRQQALAALSRFAPADKSAEAAMIAALDDPNTLVRGSAGSLLSHVHTDAAKQAIEKRIAVETDTSVRISLTEALRNFDLPGPNR